MKFQNCIIVFFPDNNDELPSSCTILYIPQFIVVFIVSLFFVLVSIAFSFSYIKVAFLITEVRWLLEAGIAFNLSAVAASHTQGPGN